MRVQHTNFIKIAFTGIIFLSYYFSNAQIEYKDRLETVYLNDRVEEKVYTNSFSRFNDTLAALNDMHFRKQIRNAKKNNDQLLFFSEKTNLELLTSSYLKTIRKGANRSQDPEAFANFIREQLPELINQFRKDNNLEKLYISSRKNTFNGILDSLPKILSIDY